MGSLKIVLSALCLIAVIIATTAGPAPAPVHMNTPNLSLDFDTMFRLVNITNTIDGVSYDFVVDKANPGPIWILTFVLKNGATVTLSSDDPSCDRVVEQYSNAYYLRWQKCAVPQSETVMSPVIIFNVDPANSVITYIPFFYPDSWSEDSGIWDIAITLGGLGATDGKPAADTLILPIGYGLAVDNPTLLPLSEKAMYPGSLTMQMTALYHTMEQQQQQQHNTAASSVQRGLYFAAHDPWAWDKQFEWRNNYHTYTDAADNSTRVVASTAVGIHIVPYDAGRLSAFNMSWSFAIGAFAGDWYGAAQLYREWSLQQSQWGYSPIFKRSDFPPWLLNNNVWINTGWQFHDVFDPHQGDPSVVLSRVQAIQKRLNMPLALHWYVWDEIAFDTGYPEYFPAKPGFADAVRTLQANKVSVAPYINGRIFDVSTKSWHDDNAELYCAKYVPEAYASDQLTPYQESYGSGATFAVMCPYTSYWQNKIAGVVGNLVANYSVAGVYIDQIGAAAAKPCWDESHEHWLAGGDYWRNGYDAMLYAARQAASLAVPALVTESNTEAFMNQVNGYLSLVAFAADAVPGARIAPVFASVYGGYYIGFGQIYLAADFDNGAVVYADKVSTAFVLGAQLGWFSLGGTTDKPPMGLYDILMSSKFDAQVAYLQLLSQYRTLAADFFNYGRLMKPVTIGSTSTEQLPKRHLSAAEREQLARLHRNEPLAALHEKASAALSDRGFNTDPIRSAVWGDVRAQAGDLAVLVTNIGAEGSTVSFAINMADYEQGISQDYVVKQVTPTGVSVLGTYRGDKIAVVSLLKPMDVLFVTIHMA